MHVQLKDVRFEIAIWLLDRVYTTGRWVLTALAFIGLACAQDKPADQPKVLTQAQRDHYENFNLKIATTQYFIQDKEREAKAATDAQTRGALMVADLQARRDNARKEICESFKLEADCILTFDQAANQWTAKPAEKPPATKETEK
jgi:hypothetical protein